MNKQESLSSLSPDHKIFYMPVIELLWLPCLPLGYRSQAWHWHFPFFPSCLTVITQQSQIWTQSHTATHGACFKKGKKSLYIPKLNKVKVFLLNRKVFYLFLVTSEHWMLKGSYLMRQLTFSIHTYYTNKIKVHF